MSNVLHSVIFHILRPLVRILHRKGIAFGEFSQIARQVYVEAAAASLLESGDKVTTSRIAITTGLTRKDVAQLRQLEGSNSLPNSRYNRYVRVISGWISDVDFQEAGQPAMLALQGNGRSFESLVNRYSGDMPYRAMLKELENNQLVTLTDDEQICLLDTAYIPREDETEKLSIMGRDVGLLISTIDHNLQPAEGKRPHFQRKVSYDNLSHEAVEQFQAIVDRKGMSLLVQLNDWLAEHDRDTNPQAQGAGRVLAGVGIYYFEEVADDAATDTQEDTPHVS